MAGMSWFEWLEKVPDVHIGGFEKKVREWAEDGNGQMYGHMTCDCLLMFQGDNPKRWLGVAYEMISSCCLQEDETVELLVRMYEEVFPELKPN